jgi:hypothetical protein
MKNNNTVDPIAAREQRAARQKGSRAGLAGIFIAHAMILLGGVSITRSIFGFLEQDMTGSDEPPLAIFGMAAGLPFILLGLFLYTGASRKFTGKLLSSPGIGPGPVLFTGLAAGAWWGSLSLPAQGAVWLIPAGFTIIACLLLFIGILLKIRRSAKFNMLNIMISEGEIAEGLITDIPEIDPSSGGLIGTITVKFSDMDGVDRWIQKTGQWKRSDLPKTGDAANVLYDPRYPENDSTIWVGPPGSSTITDFTLWHS